ncbi:alpha-mannosidase [Paenibacillus harenae]|uniref:Alpha-mannosidase n=1 Tax=Paenibacillus harenae TaxID=306543 RepID=A0ABT9U803_PAEHA|nr:alpha-mannosidase [Paenibacillus harenae]MDQ0115785.1 alpha-mannosidase [Paenibacillus harenae]
MHRINRFLKKLGSLQWREIVELPVWELRKARYVLPGVYEYETENYVLQPLEPLNSKHGITYFLRKQLDIPADWQSTGSPYGLIVDGGGGGEGMLRLNGIPYHGLDRNHTFVPLHLDGAGGSPLVEIELYDPIPEPADPLNAQSTIHPPMPYMRLKLALVDKPIQSLLYSAQALFESILLLPEHDMKRMKLRDTLHETMDEAERQWDAGQPGEEWAPALELKLVEAARVYAALPEANGTMHMVGQSHIDIAWLWPVRETVRKVSRTFSTMNTLMKEYPDFVYTQSQPLLYAFAKEHYPELYEQVKQRVAEGRWELVGGMWVEPDLNIPSGESLVRQILHGQLFYKEEFGRTSNIEWLPDTFGYCASLPQLLKLAGVDYFMTTKLNWNDTNVFPYDLFHWVGIDGTSVVSYLNHGLNEHTKPRDIHEHWQSYRHKDKLDELMLLYGHGDGGGGVTREMVELVERSSMMVDLPISSFSTAAEFFRRVGERKQSLPKWHGDLYLELHRGTYTTHARNKRNNRKAEVLYRDAEIWSQLAGHALGTSERDASIAAEKLEEGWKLILLNQFHDIIPGTAIPETYETSASEYADVFRLGEDGLAASLRSLASAVAAEGEGLPYVVFNSLGWVRDEIVSITVDERYRSFAAFDPNGERLPFDVMDDSELPGKVNFTILAKRIPAFGYTTVWLREEEPALGAVLQGPPSGTVFEDVWETEFYLIQFNEAGEIIRWFDKLARRELIAAGEKGNELQLFFDKPLSWDAWDIDPRFDSQRASSARLISKEVALQGRTHDALRFKWQLGRSTVEQDIVLYHEQKRVDFHTKVDWKEEHRLLKVAFPVDIVASKATYEIPFGALERPTHTNTSWEQAQYEVCGHRWADLSEGGYGISLLNDCKYGYDIKGTTMRLSLLRSPRWPDVTADQGEHAFTYSLLPHEADWRSAQVVRRAAELNHPVRTMEATVGEAGRIKAGVTIGVLPPKLAMVEFESEHVLLDTIKKAERAEGTVYRMYESAGGRERVTVGLPQGVKEAFIVNLLEETLHKLDIQDGAVRLDFKPFEIISLYME